MHRVFSLHGAIIPCRQLNRIRGNAYQCIHLRAGYLWLRVFTDSVTYRHTPRIEPSIARSSQCPPTPHARPRE
ncbi:hypothetical protein STRNTR1_3041 [Stenotrophomonas maltophilia]|nr:hypothetical protein STRNTR1_3041 [Stenotrophomonas maltophilia]